MKNTSIGLLAAGAFAALLFSFRPAPEGVVMGTVKPGEAALRAWLISATDTFQSPIQSGQFAITRVKAGTYRLTIEAMPPYQKAVKTGIKVTDGGSVDLGVIHLTGMRN